jgi:hypothetical protein
VQIRAICGVSSLWLEILFRWRDHDEVVPGQAKQVADLLVWDRTRGFCLNVEVTALEAVSSLAMTQQ